MAYGNGGTAIGGPIGYSGPSDTPATRMPLVALEMDRQGKAVEHLHSLISDLESRLSAVVRPDPPAATVANAPAPPMHPVALANGICDQNARLERACGRLQSILDRVEL